MALCAFPFDEDGLRIPILDAAESHVPRDILRDIPERGFPQTELHERLDGTPWCRPRKGVRGIPSRFP